MCGSELFFVLLRAPRSFLRHFLNLPKAMKIVRVSRNSVMHRSAEIDSIIGNETIGSERI